MMQEITHLASDEKGRKGKFPGGNFGKDEVKCHAKTSIDKMIHGCQSGCCKKCMCVKQWSKL